MCAINGNNPKNTCVYCRIKMLFSQGLELLTISGKIVKSFGGNFLCAVLLAVSATMT